MKKKQGRLLEICEELGMYQQGLFKHIGIKLSRGYSYTTGKKKVPKEVVEKAEGLLWAVQRYAHMLNEGGSPSDMYAAPNSPSSGRVAADSPSSGHIFSKSELNIPKGYALLVPFEPELEE